MCHRSFFDQMVGPSNGQDISRNVPVIYSLALKNFLMFFETLNVISFKAWIAAFCLLLMVWMKDLGIIYSSFKNICEK